MGITRITALPLTYRLLLALIVTLLLIIAVNSTTTTPLSSAPHDDSLLYRERLERVSSPLHSPTLTFQKIYVLSLPHRLDRRLQMNKIASALGLQLEFVDAENKDSLLFGWIAERVQETRKERVKLMAKERKLKMSTIGGGNAWLSPFVDEKGRKSFPSPKKDWVRELEIAHSNGNLSNLLPSRTDINISKILYDRNEPLEQRQVSEGVLSTYWGHTRVMKKLVEDNVESALILEDDVDLEWDLERLWSRVERVLPRDWDVTYLGHCWSHELIKPQYLHPLVHPTNSPMCLHAYALSLSGARKLLSLLSSPWSSYSVAIDLAVPYYITHVPLISFSLEPPLIIQRKESHSDIQGGKGSRWKGYLRDSTWDRIRRSEGEEVEDEEWVDGLKWWHRDPATTFKEQGDCERFGADKVGGRPAD